MQPQRLVVPLFQRPYVWNRENQWEPLWDDIIRVAERYLSQPGTKSQPHFLGAVVLQQVKNPAGLMQERTIIDGQQRLTTLQLLLDALHAELLAVGATPNALRIEPLITNAEPFRGRPEDRFKVWPTNRDRPAFNVVMAAPPPIDYDGLGQSGARLVEAHRFFSTQAREFLTEESATSVSDRANALEAVARELIHMVVIDLHEDENAQEIFETLNARGAPLTAADLIKNFVFQRLQESGADVEAAYEHHWKDFETAFWEQDVNVGRLRYPRSAIFLNHWLVAATGEEVVAREVFARFKTYSSFEAAKPMIAQVEEIDRVAQVYRSFTEKSNLSTGPIDRLGLFGYRTGVLESEVIKPLVVWMLHPDKDALPPAQLDIALNALESWMVRRMLVRATTKNYNRVVADIITELNKKSRAMAGDCVEAYLKKQTSVSSYWPDDDEIRVELRDLQAYRRLGRGRLRMVLEAVEDHLRGWRDGKKPMAEERVARGKLNIEHIMPRKWQGHWPLSGDGQSDGSRDRLIHTIGNLTLLTGRLNAKVSNGPWLGADGKRSGLEAHDVLMLNRRLLEKAKDSWTDSMIKTRSTELAELVVEIWPAPPGHRSVISTGQALPRRKVQIVDLINAARLSATQALTPRRSKYAHITATILADGRIDVDGKVYDTPSKAAVSITGKATNGWSFFLVDKQTRTSLRDVRRDYLEAFAEDVDEDEEGEDDEDNDG